MGFDVLIELLRPEFVILIAFAYVIGNVLKTTEKVDNKLIPAILVAMNAVLGAVYLLILEGASNLPLALFMGIIQGAISGFTSTGIYELKKNATAPKADG